MPNSGQSPDAEPFDARSVAQYEVGDHTVTVGRRGKWWVVWFDGVQLPGRFPTAATAWTTGVRHADDLKRDAAGLKSASTQRPVRRRSR